MRVRVWFDGGAMRVLGGWAMLVREQFGGGSCDMVGWAEGAEGAEGTEGGSSRY